MGCDIHCYIEYKRKGYEFWSDFGGRINPGRSYHLFSKLAGVRNYGELTPVSLPRGLPEGTSFAVNDDNWLFISEYENEGFCTPQQAERYISCGSVYRDEKKQFVSHPDWHSHSWLTPDEYESAIADSNLQEYWAILAAMRSFEASGSEARIVFWFDN